MGPQYLHYAGYYGGIGVSNSNERNLYFLIKCKISINDLCLNLYFTIWNSSSLTCKSWSENLFAWIHTKKFYNLNIKIDNWVLWRCWWNCIFPFDREICSFLAILDFIELKKFLVNCFFYYFNFRRVLQLINCFKIYNKHLSWCILYTYLFVEKYIMKNPF